MIQSFIQSMGVWNWWILAVILMGLEVLAPGTFFLWFGISAFVIGSISLAMGPESAFWVWQTQVIGFVIVSVISAIFGRRFMSQYGSVDDPENTNLNRRGQQLVGRKVLVLEDIAQGQGRAKIGGTTWLITGPDMPKGTQVRVVGVKGGTLQVMPDGDGQ